MADTAAADEPAAAAADEVGSFLAKHGLEAYAATFQENAYDDLGILRDLDEHDLRERSNESRGSSVPPPCERSLLLLLGRDAPQHGRYGCACERVSFSRSARSIGCAL